MWATKTQSYSFPKTSASSWDPLKNGSHRMTSGCSVTARYLQLEQNRQCNEPSWHSQSSSSCGGWWHKWHPGSLLQLDSTSMVETHLSPEWWWVYASEWWSDEFQQENWHAEFGNDVTRIPRPLGIQSPSGNGNGAKIHSWGGDGTPQIILWEGDWIPEECNNSVDAKDLCVALWLLETQKFHTYSIHPHDVFVQTY